MPNGLVIRLMLKPESMKKACPAEKHLLGSDFVRSFLSSWGPWVAVDSFLPLLAHGFVASSQHPDSCKLEMGWCRVCLIFLLGIPAVFFGCLSFPGAERAQTWH